MLFVNVLPLTHLGAQRSFDYSVPPQFLTRIQVGSLVVIKLRTRAVQAVVLALKKRAAVRSVKPIVQLIERQVVDQTVLELGKFLQSYYLAQLGESIAAILP